MQSLANPWRKRILTAACVSPLVALWLVTDRHERRELSTAEVDSARVALERLTTTSPKTHASNLSFCGATVIQNLLDDEEVRLWKIRTRQSFSKAVNVQGRFHFHVASSSPYHDELAALGGEDWHKGRRRRKEPDPGQNPLTAVVDAYFREKGVTRYSLTQLQFLNVVPGSTHQIWHKDNTEPGLTVLIALRDVGTNGPTELLLSSHESALLDCFGNALRFNFLRGNRSSTAGNQCQHLMGCLKEGDAILYDSRLLHRGRGYSVAQMDRPVLVIRWDASATPPPGSGLIKTTATRIMGSWLSTIVYSRAVADDISLGSNKDAPSESSTK